MVPAARFQNAGSAVRRLQKNPSSFHNLPNLSKPSSLPCAGELCSQLPRNRKEQGVVLTAVQSEFQRIEPAGKPPGQCYEWQPVLVYMSTDLTLAAQPIEIGRQAVRQIHHRCGVALACEPLAQIEVYLRILVRAQ